MKITFNAPVTITIAVLAAAATLVPGAATFLALRPMGMTCWLNPFWYTGIMGHIFVHQDLSHLIGNMAMFLILGTALEEKLKSGRFLILVAILTFLTGLTVSALGLFTHTSVLGASGLVFGLIMVTGTQGAKKGEIPITIILIAALWCIKEMGGVFDRTTHISNSTHLVGALWGLLYGLHLRTDETRKTTA